MLSSNEVVHKFDLVPHPEGGYFRETHRSGSQPMSTKGQTDLNVPTSLNIEDNCVKINGWENNGPGCNDEALTIAPKTVGRRPDGDIRRNCLTSIIYMRTKESPVLSLQMNLSDHVHFYQGGNSFEYITYNPINQELKLETLGPNAENGEHLQIAVRGGTWKAGRMVQDNDKKFDYCVIGEAVSPGFDYHDFQWITESKILEIPNKDHQQVLLQFVHTDIGKLRGNEVENAESFYQTK